MIPSDEGRSQRGWIGELSDLIIAGRALLATQKSAPELVPFSMLLLAVLSGCPAKTRTPTPPSRPVTRPLTVEGPAFSPPGDGRLFSRFIANRDYMHSYLYNGDDLFPKTVNLCSRGRNALLDLDRGPGASFDLGLFGPAWESHLFAVAVDRNPQRPWHTRGRTRLVYSWPVVSTAQTAMLHLAFGIAQAAARKDLTDGDFWRRHAAALRRLRWKDFVALRRPRLPPQNRRKHAGEWAQRLVIALMERLSYSAQVLGQRASAGSPLKDVPFRRLANALYANRKDAAASLTRFTRHLKRGARQAGILFDARRYRVFHERALLSSLGPGWHHGRVSADQLRSILAHLARTRRRFDRTFGAGAFDRAVTQIEPPAGPRGKRLRWRQGARLARLHPVVLRELARQEYILHGHRQAALPAARAHHGARLEADRLAYVRLAAEIKHIRKSLTTLAKTSLTPAVRARLLGILAAGEPALAVGSFYFETEHLLETTSGFTHVGLIKRFPDPKTHRVYLWVFDRVLGFHYAYPLSKLTNSVPVQALVLSARVARQRRRYRWLALGVPRVFDLGKGRISTRMTLVNLFTHIKQKLKPCPALTTTPGFFYSGITWLINHPSNMRALRDIWEQRTHTGYGYRSPDPERLQRLRGRLVYVPVLQVPGGRWTAACPPKTPTSTVAPKPGKI